jgi:opacity protein-like surface antigen
MKNFYFILFILTATAKLANAQKTKDVEFGIDFGYNNSFIESNSNYKGFTKSNYVEGYNFGISVEYYFSETWGIKGKAIYDQKGWGSGLSNLLNQNLDNINAQLNYITIPVMANWHIGDRKNGYLSLGIYDGILLKSTASGNDIKVGFNSNDLGLAFGGGIKFPVSKNTAIFIEFDVQSGLSAISSNQNNSTLTNERGALNIGINF